MTNKEAKHKAIYELAEKCYGKFFEPNRDFINNNGEVTQYIAGLMINKGLPMYIFGNGMAVPRSFQDKYTEIINNNGWTRIEPDGSNLPYDNGLYKVFFPTYNIIKLAGIMLKSVWEDPEEITPTHFKPIEEDKPPIW